MKDEVNRYGQRKSSSHQYWLDSTGYHKRYVLKIGCKECGCFIDDDCDCDEYLGEDGWFDEQIEACFDSQLKPNRRLLLTLRR